MAPVPVPPPPMMEPGMGPDGIPDLSHLSEEERQIIFGVLQRQKAEEQQEEEIAQKGDRELWDIERQIQERKENAQKLIGTQDDAICQICQKTKFADGIGHKCFYCQLRSCARCGGKTTSKSKSIWACSLCQKRQQILARTGKWFQQQQKEQAGQAQMSKSNAGSATPSPVAPNSPSPIGGASPFDQQRRQSLQTAQTASSPLLLGQSAGRQSTLHRQSSLEEQQQQQLPVVNGDRMARVGPSAVEAAGGGGGGGQRRVNGQTPRKGSGGQQQRGQQPQQQQQAVEQRSRQSGGGGGLAGMNSRKPSAPQQQTNHASPSSHVDQQQRPSTAGRMVKPNETTTGQARQRSMDESGRHYSSAKAAAAAAGVAEQQQQQMQQRRPPTAAAFVPAVPGQQQKQPSTAAASSSHLGNRQFSAVSSGGGSPSPMRTRRNKQQQQQQQLANHRQTMRSYSSSDDDLSSPKQPPQSGSSQSGGIVGSTRQPPPPHATSSVLPQSSSLQLEPKQLEQDFSEKELLRYIYESSHPSARRAAGSRGGPFFGQPQHSLEAVPGMSSPPSAAATSSSSQQQKHALARRIRNYLSNPAVSWQPSADQRRLIGHMVLYKPSSLALITGGPASPSSSAAGGFGSSLDFGLKVVGGRNRSTGRLGAFVSRVRPGSVADTVGQLRAGDEVLEWNGHSLQNVTPEAVYNIVQCTKGDSRLELIVSRPVAGGGDDFLNLRRLRGADLPFTGGGGVDGSQLPHSQSMSAYSPFRGNYSHRPASPLVLHSGGNLGSNNYYDIMPAQYQPSFPIDSGDGSSGNPRICGRLEMALLYLGQKRELIISLSRAHDLVPRPDGSMRNPYVKLFLLPDRSERSRRQSKVLSGTLNPVWDEHFFYEELDERNLRGRVLEITLWDYDDSHSFLGETLVELAQAPLNNQPFLYNLLDMDEENPLRMRLRQRRYSSMTPPAELRSRSQMSYPGGQYSSAAYGFPPASFDEEQRRGGAWHAHGSQSEQNLPFHASHMFRHGDGGGGTFPVAIGTDAFWKTAEEDWNRGANYEAAGWDCLMKRGRAPINGYLSDQEQEWEMDRRRRARGGGEHHRRREHRHQHHGGGRSGRDHRRPQSATALRNIAEWEMRHGGSGNGHSGTAADFYESEPAARERPSRHGGGGGGRRTTRPQELREQQQSGGGGGGYGSDGSVETLSVNSAQSMQNRALLRQQQIQRIREQQQQQISQQSSNEDINDSTRAQLMALEDEEDEEQQQSSGIGGSQFGQQLLAKGSQGVLMSTKDEIKEKERKKSLMTRLIPGRNGPSDASKRMGFARSEEVGIPGGGFAEALVPPEQNRDFIKQNSKESTDSSDNWLPILPDRPLGSFMENLGPGQVVGRQALGSSPLGELHVGLSMEASTGLVVDIKEARELKLGSKGVPPACYVKAYLMDGKNCVAKAKTQPSKSRTASPAFRQKLLFAENARHKMLQLTVIGDFGRMERKAFLGVAQVALDELQLSREPVDGWFKLFHSASLNGSAPQPGGLSTSGRKDSEASLG